MAILNGAHSAGAGGVRAGLDTVGEAMNDADICAFIEKAIYEEIIPVWICRVMNWRLSPAPLRVVSAIRISSISCCRLPLTA